MDGNGAAVQTGPEGKKALQQTGPEGKKALQSVMVQAIGSGSTLVHVLSKP